MNDSRDALRRRLREQRNGLTAGAQHDARDALAAAVLGAIGLRTPGTVAGYVAVRGEIDPAAALEALRASGWRVVLPVCGDDATMWFCPWDHGDALVANRFGIGEPTTDPVAPTEIDVVLVPGVGFSRELSRIGNGVGYYDRFFARCMDEDHEPLRLGVAHDLQIVDLPPDRPWDVSMHAVLTPTRTFP